MAFGAFSAEKGSSPFWSKAQPRGPWVKFDQGAGKREDKDHIKTILRRLEHLAWLLDASFVIPGTKVRFGWDSLLGIIPGAGDAVPALLSLYILIEGKRAGAPWAMVLLMLGNVVLDMLLGSVPLAGDVFDIYWKANQKNVRLLRRYLESQGKAAPRP